MTLPTSILAYQDCLDLLEKAMDDSVGVRLKMKDIDAAMHERSRIHYARKLHRRDNAKTYEEGHKMHGVSHFDAVTIRIKSDGENIYLYLERRDKVQGIIEPLSTAPELIEEPKLKLSVEKRLQIEHQPVTRRI